MTEDMPSGRIFLVNVGVNASHGAARSPLLDDGTFEFVPIPEDPAWDGPHSARYRDLPRWHGPGTLAGFVPATWAERPAHADPDFAGLTYGDECARTARARGLRQAEAGDWLFFLARLVHRHGDRWLGPPAFALVGCLRVAEAAHDICSPPAAPSATLAQNAHFRRARNRAEGWDGFSVFVGGPESGRFRRACIVDQAFAAQVLRDAQDRRYRWPRGRSTLQVIGSYTRTCRMILDPATPAHRTRLAAFWGRVGPHAADLAAPPG